MKNHEFSSEQIAWARQMIHDINDAGIWTVPANDCTYQFFHKIKELHLISGDISQDNWHEKNIALFREIGWKILDKRDVVVTKIVQIQGQGKTWNFKSLGN